MLMRQWDATLNNDQPISHVLPLEERSNVRIATGAGYASYRRAA
jgi:hypothetical protein